MFATRDEIRFRFSSAMSAMYRTEVPLYGDLLDLVADIHREHGAGTAQDVDALRVAMERHGAIRLGTAAELGTMRRVLAVMGMEPVGYYDLSVAGIPVHATAFRPVRTAALDASPFRLFTSLLRLDLIEDAALRQRASDILERRHIFTPRLLALVELNEAEGGLAPADVDAFVAEAIKTFQWHGDTSVSAAEYGQMLAAHRLVADIVCFKGPHINHLTPRTFDIDAAQREMVRRGIPAKDAIEGPPRRRCPILLRQTSFKALEERVQFGAGASSVEGKHTARFGEIEQRGQALTREGRALYDQLLSKAQRTGNAELAFADFPDDLRSLRQQGLGFFRYSLTPQGEANLERFGGDAQLEHWIECGWVSAKPIVYEDFLPVSAAGIFRSNLGEDALGAGPVRHSGSAKADFETALGVPVLNEFELYEAEQAATLKTLRARRDAARVAAEGTVSTESAVSPR